MDTSNAFLTTSLEKLKHKARNLRSLSEIEEEIKIWSKYFSPKIVPINT